MLGAWEPIPRVTCGDEMRGQEKPMLSKGKNSCLYTSRPAQIAARIRRLSILQILARRASYLANSPVKETASDGTSNT